MHKKWELEYLNGLSVLAKDIDPDDGLPELGICGLDQFVVRVFLVVDRIEALDDKFEQGS